VSSAASMWAKLSTRRCRRIFCRETEPHDSHLTIIGRIRYTNRLDLLLRERGNRG
jgi:hypothetical protein